jgi:hypothetical protein
LKEREDDTGQREKERGGDVTTVIPANDDDDDLMRFRRVGSELMKILNGVCLCPSMCETLV